MSKSILISNTNIAQKMRTLFYLKNLQTPEAAKVIESAFLNESVLLKHEAAYLLGQMKQTISIPILKEILDNTNENEIVRHECAEALGNFLLEDCYAFLKKFIVDASIPVRETCYIAVKKYEEYLNKYKSEVLSKFDSFDPAFAMESHNLTELGNLFLNSNCLYEKYKAMFALRNLNTAAAVNVLGKGFNLSSDLLKHEIAFVFGQMKNTNAIKFLSDVLDKKNEHAMVRHECAEALGAIGSEEAFVVLKKHLYDEEIIVKESVEVALDIWSYIESNEPEYATLKK